MVHLHNTLGRSIQEFVPQDEGKVSMYMCGPTVQSAPHLGHGRAYVFFDVFARYFAWLGNDVTYVINVTDVDDKIIDAAKGGGIEVREHAEAMEKQFFDGMDALGNRRPDVAPRATEHIPQMLALIAILIDKGHAYAAGGDVYFSVRTHDSYLTLSGQNLDDMQAGARVDVNDDKRDPLDFALWKGAKPGEPSWDSPWGPGRPGWHIECSAMASEYLGINFDIHGGGSDLIFPHHENEIAQTRAATGEEFARYWLHNGMLNLGGQKMAKSTGVMIPLSEATALYSAPVLRLFYLRSHYRSDAEYSEGLLDDAVAAWSRLTAFRRRVDVGDAVPDSDSVEAFRAAMDEDFNTPDAISVLFEIARSGNKRLDDGEGAGELGAAFDLIAGVLGMVVADTSLDDVAGGITNLADELGITGSIPGELIEAIIALRTEARAEKNWAVADQIRDGFGALGIVVEDTSNGVRWHRE